MGPDQEVKYSSDNQDRQHLWPQPGRNWFLSRGDRCESLRLHWKVMLGSTPFKRVITVNGPSAVAITAPCEILDRTGERTSGMKMFLLGDYSGLE